MAQLKRKKIVLGRKSKRLTVSLNQRQGKGAVKRGRRIRIPRGVSEIVIRYPAKPKGTAKPKAKGPKPKPKPVKSKTTAKPKGKTTKKATKNKVNKTYIEKGQSKLNFWL